MPFQIIAFLKDQFLAETNHSIEHIDTSCTFRPSLCLPNYMDVCCKDDELSNCGRGEELKSSGESEGDGFG